MKDNSRIALNTGVLYSRLIITTIVGLICSRVILNALGVSDYGLYAVVGGIVTFLNVIGTTMVSVSYRYLAIEIGKGIDGNPNIIYNTVFVTHALLALLLLVIGETVGIYYVDNYLNVAIGKLEDARFVLHLSLITTAFSILSVPANGLIIANEKFIYTSVIEVVSNIFRLLLVLSLYIYGGNRLRAFTIIVLLLTLITVIAYIGYCEKKYRDVVRWNFNKCVEDYKGIFVFAWWSLWGALASIGLTQGSAMIINAFFGTLLNAAYGIASHINSYVMMFTKSLYQAAVPQIMKSYGAGNEGRSLELVYVISRLSVLVLMIVVIPLLLCLDDVLIIWLKQVPEYTTIFATFIILNGIVSVLGSGFDPCIQSTGNIKLNEIGCGVINLMMLPIIYLLYELGFAPYVNVVILPFFTLIMRCFQLFIMKKLTSFSLVRYVRQSLLPSFGSLALAFVPLWGIRKILGHSIPETLIFLTGGVAWSVVATWLVGIFPNEKLVIRNYLINKMNRNI